MLGALLEGIQSVSGVDSVGLTMPIPMVSDFNSGFEVEGTETPAEGRPLTLFYAVSPGYLQAMGIPLIKGRGITNAHDRRRADGRHSRRPDGSARLDRDLPLARVRTLEALVDGTTRGQKFSTALIGVFGAAALLLAAVGVYGVMAYTVGLRRQEFAIRVVHGAQRSDIMGLVLRGSAVTAACGITIGLAAAWLLRGMLRGLLFNVSGADAFTYVSVALVLGVSAMMASAIPAWRRTRVDPANALRGE